MSNHTDKAERYRTLMRKYHDLAEQAEPSFMRDFYRKVAARYRMMAKEAIDLADAEARRKKKD
jgi:hypothetical protein